MDTRTAHALVRFGLGRRGAEALPADPASWLLDQLRQPDPTQLDDPPSSAKGLAALREDRANKPPPGESQSRALFKAEAAAQLANAVTTPAPFRERLVWFWTNHFCISLRRGECAAVAAAYVQEAIRPHVTGRFQDMVLAVMRHPAMLMYLDNATSFGPDSQVGQQTHRGLNENLARECMELHTVSPLAGYTQADVTAFANILTGWSVDLKAEPPGFRYRPFAHEPGVQTVLRQQFPPDEAGGVAALAFLSNHPATHRFLATKLARHFVADDPPPDAVRSIETVLRDTHGDLRAASAALVRLDAAWQPGAKLRTPMEFVIAGMRSLDIPPDQVPNLPGILAGLGQPLWTPPAPNGWPDRATEWASPEAMVRRIDWASGFAGRVGNRDVVEISETRWVRCCGRKPATRSTGGVAAGCDDSDVGQPRVPKAMNPMHLSRRATLLGLATSFSIGPAALALAAAPTDKRLVVVILRGALDGMAAVVPYGDPGLAGLRGEIMPPAPGQPDGLLDLGGFFGLHPALAGMHDMFKANEAMAVHAVAGSYRVRSHFEAQDCLESGADHRMTSGWLNRAVAALPLARAARPDGEALAVGVSVPLLLRGPAPVSNWAPHGFAQPAPDLYATIAALNRNDPVLGPAIQKGLRARGFGASVMEGDEAPKDKAAFAVLARSAGEMLRAPDGPRVAALELDGWDTHAAQANRLPVALKQLDAGLVALKTALGPAWAQTAVLVMTEFGRTARVNGTKGTDHGTGTVAFVLGGAVAGGRVKATWPGLRPDQLFENRDLAPTSDLRAVAKGMLAAHLGLDPNALGKVFPGSEGVEAMRGLVRV